MFPELDYYWTYARTLWNRIQILRQDDHGAISTEMAIITALLIGVIAILIIAITNRVTQEANTIENG